MSEFPKIKYLTWRENGKSAQYRRPDNTCIEIHGTVAQIKALARRANKESESERKRIKSDKIKSRRALSKGDGMLFSHALNGYMEVEKPDANHKRTSPRGRYSESSHASFMGMVKRIRENFPNRPVDAYQTQDVSEYLNTLGKDARRKQRNFLINVFKYAQSVDKFITANPAALTRPTPNVEEKTRLRLEIEDYEAILEKADEECAHLALAMRLSMKLTAGVAEICNMRFSDLDKKAHTLKIKRSKVEALSHGTIHVRIDSELESYIEQAEKSRNTTAAGNERLLKATLCPFVVNSKEARHIRSDNKEHWQQMAPDTLSKKFTEFRDASTRIKKMPVGLKPTFHEIRSLSAARFMNQVGDIEMLRKLMHHKDVKTTEIYLKRHKINWKIETIETLVSVA